MKKQFLKKTGFTLIELLVVIAIIGLLAAIVTFSVGVVKTKSRDARRVADIKMVQTALALYHNDNEAYPIYDGDITGTDVMSVALMNNGALIGAPSDPLAGSGANYKYVYQSVDGRTYVIQYFLETDSIKGLPAGINTVSP